MLGLKLVRLWLWLALDFAFVVFSFRGYSYFLGYMVRMQCLIESNWFCQFLISNSDFYIALTLPWFFFWDIVFCFCIPKIIDHSQESGKQDWFGSNGFLSFSSFEYILLSLISSFYKVSTIGFFFSLPFNRVVVVQYLDLYFGRYNFFSLLILSSYFICSCISFYAMYVMF